MKNMIRSLAYSIRRMFPVNGAVVLMYHSVGENNLFFTVNGSEFEKQMAYLMRENFNVISLRKLEEYLKERNIPPKTIAITFDDGYRDNLTNSFLTLKKHNFPATIFITTDDIGRRKNVRGHEFKMLSEEDIKELEQSGLINIEPHTVNHPKLARLNSEEINYEIGESKRVLEYILDKVCSYFAYPFGSFDDNVLNVVKKHGFRLAFTVKKGRVKVSTKRLLLPRNSIDSEVSLKQFKNIARLGRI